MSKKKIGKKAADIAAEAAAYAAEADADATEAVAKADIAAASVAAAKAAEAEAVAAEADAKAADIAAEAAAKAAEAEAVAAEAAAKAAAKAADEQNRHSAYGNWLEAEREEAFHHQRRVLPTEPPAPENEPVYAFPKSRLFAAYGLLAGVALLLSFGVYKLYKHIA